MKASVLPSLDGYRLGIACGGTGGHFYPTLAIATCWRQAGGDVRLLVAGHHAAEHLQLAEESNLQAVEVPAVRMRKDASMLAFPFRFLGAMSAAKARIREFSPQAFLGMGSFAAAPACLAAHRLGLPLLLHESNAWMGRANRMLSRWARAVAVSLPIADSCPCRCPMFTVGAPLRQPLLDACGDTRPDEQFLPGLGLRNGCPTILVFGGSQGAQAVNDLIAQTATALGSLADQFQLIHLTGTDDNGHLVNAYAAAGLTASVRRADYSIQNCYLAADLVICRSGASTLAELALFGKPSILIPLPTAAEDHQTANARVLADAGAAMHLPQREATPDRLLALLRDWLEDRNQWQSMSQRVRTFAHPDAAEEMVNFIVSAASGS